MVVDSNTRQFIELFPFFKEIKGPYEVGGIMVDPDAHGHLKVMKPFENLYYINSATVQGS